MRERIRHILKEETSDQTDIIKQILDYTIMQEHGDIICDIEVKHPSKREVLKGQNPYKEYSVIVTFKMEPNSDTMSLIDMPDDITTKVWRVIYDYTGMHTQVYYRITFKCE